MKDRVDAKEFGLGFQNIHGPADVVPIGGWAVLVDLKDDAVIVRLPARGGDDFRLFRRKAGPGGDEVGDVVVEFGVQGESGYG